jgi:transposase
MKKDRNKQAKSVIIICKLKGMSYRQIADYLNQVNF